MIRANMESLIEDMNMKNYDSLMDNIKKLVLFLLCAVPLVSCGDEMLSPYSPADLTEEEVWSHATYGEGVLGQAYINLNTEIELSMDYYTDNAIPRTQGANNLALGNWTLEGNPIGSWVIYYNSIRNLNMFLDNAYDLTYQVGEAQQDSLLRSHRIGEAFYLRGWYQWQLLQHYAGFAEGSNEALGFPILTDVPEEGIDINLTRNTYEEGVAQIAADLDSAIVRLPLRYDGSGSLYGLSNRGRGSGLAALALKARVYLYAASPAYGDSNPQLWERAAEAAYEAIDASGGLTPLAPFGNFNDFSNFDHIWIQPTYVGNGWENFVYPPSLFGFGDANPSQNLVDAFPAADGKPISESTLYDESIPYENRDPRFNRFIFFNGDQYNGTTIETFDGGSDAPGGLTQRGTRTGYYIKKFTSTNVSLSPSSQTTDIKFKVYLGRNELYLNFAEAANEAFGPNDARYGYSASDVLGRVRERAGVTSDDGSYQDDYLVEQATMGSDSFRELVHNERRIELAFEGHRFWDIRRWDYPLNHTIRGVQITRNDDEFIYQYRDVEDHVFQDHMRYVPLPYDETLLMSNLQQNRGW